MSVLLHSMPSAWHIGSPNKYLQSALERDLEVMCLTLRNPIFEYLHSFTEALLCPIWAFIQNGVLKFMYIVHLCNCNDPYRIPLH